MQECTSICMHLYTTKSYLGGRLLVDTLRERQREEAQNCSKRKNEFPAAQVTSIYQLAQLTIFLQKRLNPSTTSLNNHKQTNKSRSQQMKLAILCALG